MKELCAHTACEIDQKINIDFLLTPLINGLERVIKKQIKEYLDSCDNSSIKTITFTLNAKLENKD